MAGESADYEGIMKALDGIMETINMVRARFVAEGFGEEEAARLTAAFFVKVWRG